MKKRNLFNNDVARYSSIAMQMAVIIAIGVFGGWGLDRWIDIGFPLFTILLSLGSVVLAIYVIIKDLAKPK